MYTANHLPGGDEEQVARKLLERLPDHDHAGALERLVPLDEFHQQLAPVAANPALVRQQLECHAAEIDRATLLASLAAGDPTPRRRPPDHRAIACLMLKGQGAPAGVKGLVARMTQAVASDEGELRQLRAELDTCDPHHTELRRRFDRIAILEGRIPGRKRALEQIRAALPGALAKAFGTDTEAVASGVVEARTLRGLHGPADVEADRRQLAQVDDQLLQLQAVAGDPGPMAIVLRNQRDQVQARIDATRAEHARAIRAAAGADVERIRGGDLDALVAFHQLVAMHPAAFPAGLADALNAACQGALTRDEPVTWARVLEAAGTKQPREF